MAQNSGGRGGEFGSGPPQGGAELGGPEKAPGTEPGPGEGESGGISGGTGGVDLNRVFGIHIVGIIAETSDLKKHRLSGGVVLLGKSAETARQVISIHMLGLTI